VWRDSFARPGEGPFARLRVLLQLEADAGGFEGFPYSIHEDGSSSRRGLLFKSAFSSSTVSAREGRLALFSL